MRNTILLIHLSVDGLAAGPNGDLGYFSPSDENLAFVVSLTANADAALFGRNSFQLLEAYWPQKHKDPTATTAEIAYSNWYNTAQKIVVSASLPDTTTATILRKPDLNTLKQQSGKNILIFGSPSLSAALLQANQIDECWVFIHPHFFGKGLPLFPSLPYKVNLSLQKIHPLPQDQIALHYTIKKGG